MGLDTVEIILAWETSFGVTLENSEVSELRTPRQAIDLIAVKLGARESTASACLSMRAFHHLRDAISKTADVSRSSIRPDSRVKDLLRDRRPQTWASIRAASGISLLPEPGWFSPHTVAALSHWAVRRAARELKPAGEPWTRGEIRCVVRGAIAEVAGSRQFEDTDDFIYDLGFD
ncbi:MAG TPA: hypothetical protein VFG14_20255 [Chthoniobacteraceae bacterium]|nr:hypothetical protein [Chthoniobacteraceae bacterium]